MKKKFNGGKAFHGESTIGGLLHGATDTDYFYFFCPKCDGNHVMRILDYTVLEDEIVNPYNTQMKSKAERGFTLAFKLHCEKCRLTDFVKVSNLGWQSGEIGRLAQQT